MAKGRKPITNEMRILRGTNKKYRMRNEGPETEKLSMDDISISGIEGLITERSKKIYIVKCKQLAALKVMEDAYREQMVIYAYNLDKALLCHEMLEKEGIVVMKTDREGNTLPTISGWLKAYNQFISIVNDISKQFGFTPITRSSIKFEEDKLDPVAAIGKLMG